MPDTRLLSEADIAASLRTPILGRKLVYVASCTSTMDVATREAAHSAPEGTVVLADAQTAGRGRLGRAWVSPPGQALYLSIVLRPKPEHLLAVNMAATLAIVYTMRDACGLPVRVKWPNDILSRGRKLAGVLLDTDVAPGAAQVITGIGLNLSLDPAAHPEIAAIATSVEHELGHPVAPIPVLAALLEQFEWLYLRAQAGASLLEEWRAALDTLGRQVTVTYVAYAGGHRGVERGMAYDVDEDGALLLRRDDGSTARVTAGEVTLSA